MSSWRGQMSVELDWYGFKVVHDLGAVWPRNMSILKAAILKLPHLLVAGSRCVQSKLRHASNRVDASPNAQDHVM